MPGGLIGKGSATPSTVASPSASRRTIERRVGSDKAAKTTSNRSNRSGAVTGIVAVLPADTSQVRYLTERLSAVKAFPCRWRPARPPGHVWVISQPCRLPRYTEGQHPTRPGRSLRLAAATIVPNRERSGGEVSSTQTEGTAMSRHRQHLTGRVHALETAMAAAAASQGGAPEPHAAAMSRAEAGETAMQAGNMATATAVQPATWQRWLRGRPASLSAYSWAWRSQVA